MTHDYLTHLTSRTRDNHQPFGVSMLAECLENPCLALVARECYLHHGLDAHRLHKRIRHHVTGISTR